MIAARDYYRAALESIRDDGDEPDTIIFKGWLEAKMRDADRTVRELTPETLLPPRGAPVALPSAEKAAGEVTSKDS